MRRVTYLVPTVIALGLGLSACGSSSSSSSPSTSPSTTAAHSAMPSTTAAASTSSAPSNPCDLITTADLQTITGNAYTAIESGSTSSEIRTCEFQPVTNDGSQPTFLVSYTTPTIFGLYATGQSIPGIGDKAALTHSGALDVKVGSHYIQISATGSGAAGSYVAQQKAIATKVASNL